MKSLLPLLLVAAAAQAQTAPVKAPAESFSFTVDNHMIARDVDDFDGMSYGIKAKVWDDVRMTLVYADAESDPFDLVTGLYMKVKARRWAVGAEYDLPAGPGGVTLSFAYAQTSATSQGGFNGDAFGNDQFVFGARYKMELGQGFTTTIAATKFVSDFDSDTAFSTSTNRAALATRYDGSPFAVSLSLGYAPTEHVNIHVTYAKEDSVLGLGGAKNTLSFGVSAVF